MKQFRISGHGLTSDSELIAFSRKRFGAMLDRFSGIIRGIEVRLRDLNGPKGGADQECSIAVDINGKPTVVSTATHENSFGAVSLAVQRVRKQVERVMKRRIAKRKQL